MNKRKALDDFADDCETTMLVVCGMDDAIIGVTCNGFDNARVAYSYQQMVYVLTVGEGMSHEDAIEHIQHNIIGAYVAEAGPIFIDDLSEYENAVGG